MNSTDVELYQVIEETLEKLNDNHGFIEASNAVYEALEKQTEQKEETATEESPEIGDFYVARKVVEHHLQEELTEDSQLIQWGKLADEIGFIQIKAMWLLADLDVPIQLIEEVGYVNGFVQTFHQLYEGDFIEKEVDGVSKIMDKVIKDLPEMEAIVIDVRFNGGGQDAVSFEILRRFIHEEKLQIATQKLRYGNKFTPTLPLFLKGKDNAYSKPVYVLTSRETGSAAEAFANGYTINGKCEKTWSCNIGGDVNSIRKTIPNGWSFAISNEIYRDNHGKCYENIGIPVDYDLNYSNDRQTFFRSVINDLEADKRNVLSAISNIQ